MFPFLIRQLADTSGISRLRRDWEAGQPVADDEFDVQLTAYDSITGHYSWTEQTYSATGGFIDKPGGRSGTALTFPAKTFNGEVLSVPRYARIRKRIPVASYVMIYEILQAAASFSGAKVSSSTLTLTSAAVLTVTFSTENFDTDTYFTLASPTLFTIAQTGYYAVGAEVHMFPDFSGNDPAWTLYQARIMVGGGIINSYDTGFAPGTGNSVFLHPMLVSSISVGATVSLELTKSATLFTNSAACSMWIVKLG